MKTRTITLRKTAKAVLVAVLLCAAGMTKIANAQSLTDWEMEQPFLFYLVYDDVQAWLTKMPDGINSHAIRDEQLPHFMGGIGCWHHDSASQAQDPNCPCVVNQGWLCMAKNEREGFQVFYREHEKSRNLRVEVSPFLNAQNEVLEHTVYYEEFFHVDTVITSNHANDLLPIDDSLAEALIPYHGEPKVTQVNYNKMFYIELVSRKDQSPGDYVSYVTICEGEDTLASKPVAAKVWNFALPEGHYSEVVMGLYNRNSGYKSTSTFLTLNDIQVDNNGNVAPEDLDEAKRILHGYQNCLLEHGVSTYEIPRWLMEDDPKAAELTMADPRRKVFTVPVLYGDLESSGSDFKPSAQQVLLQYKDMVYNNPFLKDKAFFYPYDEPENATDFAAIDQFCSVLSDYWPGYHATVPFYSDYYSTVEAFEGKIDILCPTHSFFYPKTDFSDATTVEQRLRNYMNLPHKWWKPDNLQIGGLDFFVDITGSAGVIRRILFWQQYLAHGQGLLYWNCAFLPDNWQKKHMPLPEGIRNGNGDGILLYPGMMFGQDAATPVVSLRLKQLAAGIDDYDYMHLVEEFLGEQRVWDYLNRAFDFGNHNFPSTLCGAWNRQLEVYRGYTCHPTQISRWWYGYLLDAANTEHEWGEWQTAVLPDATHTGLEIRTCSHCGAQESRELAALPTSTQEIALVAGWNWWSTNVDITLDHLKTTLVEALPGTNITINSQSDGSITYTGAIWRGTLNALDVSQMYMINVTDDCEIMLTGLPVSLADHPAIIHSGFNWMAFPLSQSMTLTNAFTDFVINGDMVISQSNGSSTYTNLWRGSLTTLMPGKGYMYKSATSDDRTFTFPIRMK